MRRRHGFSWSRSLPQARMETAAATSVRIQRGRLDGRPGQGRFLPERIAMNSKNLLAGLGIAAALLAAPLAVKAEEAKDIVTVTTKDYVLTAHTPEGWVGDTEGAKKYQGVVIFSPKGAG